MPLKIPVVLILYKRPHLTEAVFSAIAEAQPRRLFLVADGPMAPSENVQCQRARSVIDRVDWDCAVDRDFSEANLGCRRRVATGLDWVFSQVEEAIILEDDCLPHSCFFRFCETLLDKYRDDERVMEIGGANYQFGSMTCENSYYFSKYAHTHGWATWRRAWRHFDESISMWPQLKESGQWELLCDDATERQYWTSIYNAISEGELKTSWDYQWQLARWRHGGLSAVPKLNLVTNIGFGRGATHTHWKWSSIAKIPAYDIGEIRHPESMTSNAMADRYMFEKVFLGSSFQRTLRRARHLWRSGPAN